MKNGSKLILMRHGQSVWNKLNLFTGWVDVPLSQEGIDEALEGGKKIQNIPIDVIFVSSLVRAKLTAFLAMSQHESGKVPVVQHDDNRKLKKWGKVHGKESKGHVTPVYSSWKLNERMYGELQGLNKDETRAKYGEEQVRIWRRSFDTKPPGGESLKDTAARTLPYFKKTIIPYLKKGQNVFISAHGNSLRAITMFLEDLSKEEVLKLEIATGEPIIYDYVSGKFVKE